jgi:MFS family permease
LSRRGRSAPPDRPRFFYGWVIAAVSSLAAFGSVVFFNPVLGLFSGPLREEFGWSSAEVALAISLGSGGAALTSPLTGWLIDRWGGRGVISLWQLLLFYAIGRALSVGTMSPAAFVAVSNWFVRRRAFVGGIVAASPRVGMATFPLLAAIVIDVSGTWRAGWVALGLVILVVGVLPPSLLLRRRPEDMGLLPDGAPALDDLDGLEGPREVNFTLGEAARTRAYWLLGGGISLVLFAGGSVNFHQIPHLVDQGMPTTQAALVVTVFSVVGALGALIGGGVASRITMRWTMALSLFGMAASIPLLIVSSSLPLALIYALVYGTVFGSMVALNQVIYADYFGRAQMGLIRGSVQPLQLGMNAAGPFVTGLWFDATGSYTAPFSLFAVLFLLAGLAFAFSPYPQLVRSGVRG